MKNHPGLIAQTMFPVKMAGVVAVDWQGVLVLLVSDTKKLDAGGYLAVGADGHSRPAVDRPIVLGRLGDWLASGRSFPAWTRDRGYMSPVPEGAGRKFLQEARKRRII